MNPYSFSIFLEYFLPDYYFSLFSSQKMKNEAH